MNITTKIKMFHFNGDQDANVFFSYIFGIWQGTVSSGAVRKLSRKLITRLKYASYFQT